jgi:hypothetical protein
MFPATRPEEIYKLVLFPEFVNYIVYIMFGDSHCKVHRPNDAENKVDRLRQFNRII